MIPKSLAATVLLALAAVGCGARTGLLEASRDEVAPDASPELPCTYELAGGLEPILAEPLPTYGPALAWADDRLAVSFTIDEPRLPGGPTVPVLGFCTTSARQGWTCSTHERIGDLLVGRSSVAWDGEGVGLCWTGRFLGGGAGGVLLRRFELDHGLVRETFLVESDIGRCWGLAWSPDRYLVVMTEDPDSTEEPAAVVEVSRDGAPGDRLLAAPYDGGIAPPIVVAASDGVAAAVTRTDEGAALTVLAGPVLASILLPAPAGFGNVALALRGATAAVLWTASRDGRREITLTLVDLDAMETLGAATLEGGDDWSRGTSLLAVPGGFLAALHVHHGPVSVAPFVTAGGSVEAGDPLTIPGSEHPGLPDEQLRAALATDGLDVYVAVTGYDFERDWSEVQLQRLACTR